MARRKCQFIMTFSPGFLILFTLFRGVNAGFVRFYKGLLCFVLCFMGVILIDVIFFALDAHTNGHRVVYAVIVAIVTVGTWPDRGWKGSEEVI